MISSDLKTFAKDYITFARANGKDPNFESFKLFWNENGPGPQNKYRDGNYYKSDKVLLSAWNEVLDIIYKDTLESVK